MILYDNVDVQSHIHTSVQLTRSTGTDHYKTIVVAKRDNFM